MNQQFIQLVTGLIIAHLLLWASFAWQPVSFWIIFSFALFILIGISIGFGSINSRMITFGQLLLAVGSGVGLYALFTFGKFLIGWLNLPFLTQLNALYALVQPIEWWHFLVLFLIVIPGEELFWRGFVFQKLRFWMKPVPAIFISTVLYAVAHIYAGTLLLLVAALVAGPVWSYLYYRTENMVIPIVSHSIFNLFLLVLFPLL
ncbi:CPBP family intramembrane glutamic endopeptidase [Alkalihalobacterium chitinilyticum]|uniref:CPBP family intramembrane metalloprotease n=1 Tax=Alkalihalobacterium chitinilyticum TaxID=2980103 RepID=A0ABT5V9Q0_9BACI|nr:type II CAAX endopeptidase family protein [Alkalihalobacterium chitinilyticum]MDE5412188.1 CPBP family intramembrane metalloprotease [Alkalihalobacterium chitinilyticum]